MNPPVTADAKQLIQQGLLHHRQGDLKTAMERYTEVLRNDPQNADALYYIALVACHEGQFKEGLELARRALAVGAPQPRLHNLIGKAHERLGQMVEAAKAYDAALALDPNFAEAHGNRANLLVGAGMLKEALAAFGRALMLDPKSVPDLVNRGALLEQIGQPAEALKDYDRAVALDPNFALLQMSRGNALKDVGLLDLGRGMHDSPHFDAALAAYDRAIELNPKLDEIYATRGQFKVMRGDWLGGFPDYNHRVHLERPAERHSLPDALWDGTPLAGERLVLVDEQGLGDVIQFCRFAPMLATRGYDVTVLVRKSLLPLISTLRGVKIAGDAEELRQDERPLRWLPLLGVPGLLGITPETLPREVPYLSADPQRVQDWGGKLGSARFKIGINWAPGHVDRTQSSRRDLPLSLFAVLAELPNVELIALQQGAPAQQIANVAFRDKIRIIEADANPAADLFLDTAAVMTHLDLVIGCDTSIVHLAGALARPVFTAVPVISDWRWMLSRDDTPWYPTMRLFRQDASRQWAPVLARMASAVRAMLAAGSANISASQN